MRTLRQIEWSTEQAAAEFDINPRTLSKRFKQLGIEPSLAGGKRFSTKQVCSAVFGDIDGERLRKTKLEADLLELENGRLKSELLPRDEVLRTWSDVIVSIRQVIKGSHLSDTEQRECLRHIKELNVEDFSGKEKTE